MAEDHPPEGFLRVDFDRGRPDPTFNGHIGTLYAKRGAKGSRDEFVLGFRVERHMCNPAGGLHGGMMMTAADSAAAVVSLTVWGAETRIATTDMNIRFLAPARSDVRLFAQAIKQGQTLIPTIINFWRDDGTLVAVAQVTYMRLT